jgi:hypothetical protein
VEDNITAYYVARNAIYQIKAIAAIGTTFLQNGLRMEEKRLTADRLK